MNRVRRMLTVVVCTLFACYALLCLAAFLGANKLIYFPGPAPTSEPKDFGVEGRTVLLKSSDNLRLWSWLVPAEHPRGIAIVLHGNAGSRAERIDYAKAFREMGLSTLIVDYRGYGGSDGSPTEEGTYLDAEAAYEYATRALSFQPGQILVFGESLGGAVAVELALRHTVGGVILQDTFTSIADMGARIYPWLPIRLLARGRYETLSKIASVPVPLLILHSKTDEVVPFEHGERLFAAANQPKTFVETTGSHDGSAFFTNADWTKAVRDHVDRVLDRKGKR